MIVIVGGGYAGAATAWALARRGVGRQVVLLEAEPSTGMHASGRNAGLIGAMLEEDASLVEMAVRGARLLAGPIGKGSPPLVRCGSVRLVTEGPVLDAMLRRAREVNATVDLVPTAEIARTIPLLRGASSAVALRCMEDGKIDPPALVAQYVDSAADGGVRVVTGARVTGFMHKGGAVSGVETTMGRFDSTWVVNAAGAWAGPLARLAGLEDLGLVSYRRHLFGSVSVEGIDPSWPWVWDLTHDVYFRVDSDRLLLCSCDVEAHPSAAPEISPVVAMDLARKLAAALPMVARVEVETARACLRTFAPDRRYVIGPDPRLEGFFWVAGLGGTGATSGAAVGELAADLIVDATKAPPRARDFDPARFLPAAQR